MLPPIRCISCNYPVGDIYDEYCEYIKTCQGNPYDFGKRKQLRMCCRRTLFTSINITPIISDNV